MSGRPQRASALAAQQAIQARRNNKLGDEDEDRIRSDSEDERPMRKKRKIDLEITPVAPSHPTLVPLGENDSLRLSDDIWALIIAGTVSTNRRISETLELRTICKSISAVTTAACNSFWRAVCENLRPEIVETMASMLEKAYQGMWFNLARFCFTSHLALPSYGCNPGRTGFCGPLQVPEKPQPQWVRNKGTGNRLETEIVPYSLCCWGNSVFYATRSMQVVCLDLRSGNPSWTFSDVETRAKTDKLKINDEYLTLAHAGLEVRVVGSQTNSTAPHLDFYSSASVVSLFGKRYLVSISALNGSLEWLIDFGAKESPLGFKASAHGGLLVLSHAVIVPVVSSLDNEICVACFSALDGRLLWQTNLNPCPETAGLFEAVRGKPAADMKSGILTVPLGDSDGEATYFASFNLFTGKLIKALNDVAARDNLEWCPEAQYAVARDEAIFYSNDPDEQDSSIQSVNLISSEVLIEAGAGIEPSLNQASADNADDDDDDEVGEEDSEKTGKKKKEETYSYHPEWTFGIALDSERRSILTTDCSAGGGGAFDVSIVCLTRSAQSTAKVAWVLHDGDSRLENCFGADLGGEQLSLYGSYLSAPICTSSGSAWIGFDYNRRFLLTLSSSGEPTAFMPLQDIEGNSIEPEHEFDLPSLSHSVLRLARSTTDGINYWAICATPDCIWAASS